MNRKKFLGTASTVLLIIVATLTLASSARGQATYKTLHKFTGNNDGSLPQAALILDGAGNLYGTTGGGGAFGGGTAFKLTPNSDGSWKETVLHNFCTLRDCRDGANVQAPLILDSAGNLYGTTSLGGVHESGTVFELMPNSAGYWTEKLLYSFNNDDGYAPLASLVFDQSGNLYGTTNQGGTGEHGLVFELTPNPDGTWTETTLYTFGGTDGEYPFGALILDQAGNLYGTTYLGGAYYSGGAVFKLTRNSDGSWTESVLYSFPGGPDGAGPIAGVIFDQGGNLYGTTEMGGGGDCFYDSSNCGVVFKLTPNSDGSWTEDVLYQFTGGKDGGVPWAGLIFDPAGNLYGTTIAGGDVSYCGSYPAAGCGVVFKLTPESSGGWIEQSLYAFKDFPSADPVAGVIFDAAGNLYGTTKGDGTTTFGTVFEITP